MSALRVAVLGMGVLLAHAVPASAMLCRIAPVCEEYWRVSDVFVGVARVTPLQPSGQRLSFAVEESLKGTARRGDNVPALSPDRVEHNVQYLVFGVRDAEGRVRITCSRTAPLGSAPAAENLSYVRRVKSGELTAGRVAGYVSFVKRYRRNDYWTPVAQVPFARVMLYNASKVWMTETTQRGRFVFPHVPPGTYALQIQTPLEVRTVSLLPSLKVHSADRVEIQGPGACASPFVGVPLTAGTRRE